MKMMPTFQEVIDNNEYTFPEYVDGATQTLLVKHFGLRRVKKNYARFLDIDFDTYWNQYLQLLRTDPQHIKIDWFVEKYMERQNYTHGAENKEGGGIENYVTDNLKTKTGMNFGSNGVKHSGSDTRADDLTHATTYRSGNTHVDNTHTITEGASDANRRDMRFERNNPMSQSYSKDDMMGIYYSGGKKENGESGAQKLVAGNKGTLSNGGKTANFPYPNILNPSASGDALQLNADVSYNRVDNGGDYSDKRNGSDTLRDTGSETYTHGHEINNSYNDNFGENYKDVKDEGREKHSNESVENERLNREVYSGRDTLPSEVLSRATAFIKSTNAFKWLCETLSSDFSQSYRMEDYV